MPTATYEALRDTLNFYNDSYIGEPRYSNPEPSTLSSVSVTNYGEDEHGRRTTLGNRSFLSYLIPHPSEDVASYAARKDFAGYLNVVKPIVHAYAEGVTANVQRSLGQLQDKLGDVDYRGTPYAEFIEDFAKKLCVYGFCFAAVDTDGQTPKVIPVSPAQVAWVTVDDFGRIQEFAYINQATYTSNASTTEQHLVIRVVNQNGWMTLEGKANLSKGFDPSTFKQLSRTPLATSLNGELPILVAYYERDSGSIVPMGISLIGDSAKISRMVYNLLSWATDIHKKAGFPILFIPMSKTGGAMPADTRKEVGPDRSIGYSSETGAPQWGAPSSESTKELREHSVFLIQWAFKLQGLELAADQSTQTVSGINLRVRAREFESKAKRFANQLQRFEEKLLRLMAKLAGVSEADISVAYPKTFTLPDSTEHIANALAVLDLSEKVDIGIAARVQAIKQILSAALPITDEVLSTIMAEVTGNLEAEARDQNSERELVNLYRQEKAKTLQPSQNPPQPLGGSPEPV